MMITTAKYNQSGSIDAIIDDVPTTVPNDLGNRHRAMLAEWETEGNTITPWEPSMQFLQEIKIAEAEAYGNHLMVDIGFPWDFGGDIGVNHLQVRNNDDRTNWLTIHGACVAALMGGQGDVLGVEIRTLENNTAIMTFMQAFNMLNAMTAWGQTIYTPAWKAKDAIRATTTQEELDSIDIPSYWAA